MPFRLAAPDWFDRLDSTNEQLLKDARALPACAVAGVVVAAREQTAGRGRRGRSWHSPPGQNLLFSFLWRSSADPRNLASLGMASAAGVAAFLVEEKIGALLKWPNDVWVDGAKIAGVLVETIAAPEGVAAVVGVGLNVNLTSNDLFQNPLVGQSGERTEGFEASFAANMDPHLGKKDNEEDRRVFPRDARWGFETGRKDAARIGTPATSIFLQTGREWSVEATLERLSPFLERAVGDWEAGGFGGVRDAWERLAWRSPGDRVRVSDGTAQREGRFAGYGEFGELLLETEDAGLVAVWSGDTSAE